MQLWSKCLVCALMMVFVAGTVTQTVHAGAMSVPTTASAPGAALTITSSQDGSALTADSDMRGCLGCAGNNDGAMSCAGGCSAQFVGLLAAPPAMIARAMTRPDYSTLVLGLWEWRSSPDPYPPRPLTYI